MKATVKTTTKARVMKSGRNIEQKVPYGLRAEGYFVLENKNGETVRSFTWEDTKVVVVYRFDNRRIETVASTKDLEEAGIDFEVLASTTQAKLKKTPLAIGEAGQIRWVSQIDSFSEEYELEPEVTMEPKQVLGWSAGLQVALATVMIVAGLLSGSSMEKQEVSVKVLTQEDVQKMMEPPKAPEPEKPKAQEKQVAQREQAPQKAAKNIVVAPSETKITKNTPVPKRSTSFKKTATAHSKGPRGGGYKGEGARGYGTNERHMNQIGALGALNTVKGGNGGSGGLNLQAVGTEEGSGAGGRGHGGFGSNGGGGRGKGGLGTGRGMGLANAMYGKGLIAAPHGDGGAAPGSGGYGTRGANGGGARGAGYGSETVVGSWKGTGPKGNGPAGSGVGNGDPNGSPFGIADGDDGDAVVTGGLDRDQINEVIMRNIGQIRYCYEQGLQRNASLSGRVSVRFQINGSGGVSSSAVKHSSVHSAQVESCIAGKVRGWRFPKPQGGVNVSVTYPFSLRRNL